MSKSILFVATLWMLGNAVARVDLPAGCVYSSHASTAQAISDR